MRGEFVEDDDRSIASRSSNPGRAFARRAAGRGRGVAAVALGILSVGLASCEARATRADRGGALAEPGPEGSGLAAEPHPDGSPPASPSAGADGAAAQGAAARTLFVIEGTLSIYRERSFSSAVVGTVRPGGFVRITPNREVLRSTDCAPGWLEVQPEGVLCPLSGTTWDASSVSARALREHGLSTTSALPAHYGVAEATPVYERIPTREEQDRAESSSDPDASKPAAPRARSRAATSGVASGGGVEVPPELRDGSLAPSNLRAIANGSPVVAILPAGTKVAWVDEFRAGDRAWLLTPDLLFLPGDRVDPLVVSGFHGVELDGEVGVAFVGTRSIHPYRLDARTGRPTAALEEWPPRSAHLLLPDAAPVDDVFMRTIEPEVLLRTTEAIVARPTEASDWGLDPKSRWIEVDARSNLLLLHEGAALTYATLVSVGKASVARGRHGVIAKYLTKPSIDGGLVRPFRAEVPEVIVAGEVNDPRATVVLYADGARQMWGASNGGAGIALAPLDARRVFDWASPALPEGWHSVQGQGSFLVVHD